MPTNPQYAAVWNGTLNKTSGGLTRADLTKNKAGKIVSKARSQAAKRSNNLMGGCAGGRAGGRIVPNPVKGGRIVPVAVRGGSITVAPNYRMKISRLEKLNRHKNYQLPNGRIVVGNGWFGDQLRRAGIWAAKHAAAAAKSAIPEALSAAEAALPAWATPIIEAARKPATGYAQQGVDYLEGQAEKAIRATGKGGAVKTRRKKKRGSGLQTAGFRGGGLRTAGTR